MTACTRDLQWYYHIIVGLISFFGGLLILLPFRIFWYLCCKDHDNHGNSRAPGDDRQRDDYNQKRAPLLSSCSRLRAAAIALISGHTFASKILVVVMFLMNMTSVVIYLIEASEYTVDDCGPMRGQPLPLLYIALCVIFAIHYIIRFIAATDKTYFWLDVYSIVDHFTIGPIFMSLYLDSNWLGLRFLRLLYLLQLPEILQMTHLVKLSSRIRLTQIASIFIAIWLCSAGFVHLIENNGDPFHDYDNSQQLHYWECVYWLLITMSTVGFGDISPKSDTGRLFILLFIMGTFAMFTSIIPELAKHLGHSTKYSKPYKRIYGKRHIVVCGHISYASVSNFIRNFIHEDSAVTNTNVVFIDNQKPDLELEAYFKRHMNDVTFIQGSIMDMNTLKNCKLKYCEACLILANRNCDDPDEQDSANIMRATSVKNYNPHIRVIIQLLQQHNKAYLLHIPNWNWDKVNGDDVICISELKLGLLAQNCLAPGVCTLMANLFTMRSFKLTATDQWQDVYRYGAGNEIYSEQFAPAFIGMSFAQAAEVCFTKFNVLLLGVNLGVHSRLRLNPPNLTIGTQMTGFFIAQSPTQVHRVANYKEGHGSSIFVNMEKNGNKLAITPVTASIMASTPDSDQTSQYLEYLEEVGSRLAFHSTRSPRHTPPIERRGRKR